MSLEYITFKKFKEEDYEKFINDIPKKILIKPLRKIQKYKTHPRIKSFRDESVDEKFVRDLYLKEFRNKSDSLQNHLLMMIDKCDIKKVLSTEEYELLSNNKCSKKELENIALKVLENSAIKPEYLIKLLDLSEDIIYKYKSEKNNEKRRKELENLKQSEEKLKKEVLKLQHIIEQNTHDFKLRDKEYESIIKENILLHEENKKLEAKLNEQKDKKNNDDSLLKTNMNDILKLIEGDINDLSYSSLLTVYENMNLKNLDLSAFFAEVYRIKQNLMMHEQLKEIKSIVFIEYMMIKIKEIIING
jgi:hypothetical protein